MIDQPGSNSVSYAVEYRKHPGGDPCVAGVSLAGAPTEPGQHHDEGDDVEQRRHHRVHNLQPQERERKLYLDIVSDLQKVVEHPDQAHYEACDDNEEKPVVVSQSKIVNKSRTQERMSVYYVASNTISETKYSS